MKTICAFAGIFLQCSVATADIVQMVEVPTTWKLENYQADNVVAWYTGSSCTNGKVSFSSRATTEDKNRFWAVVLVGKTTGKKIFVRYETETVNCEMNSFGIHE